MRTCSFVALLGFATGLFAAAPEPFSSTHKPVLHARHWVAITGKPAGALAGARMFEKGGNAIDAACAMLAVVCTMHDDVGWGGETQALIYDPRTKKVIGINALGVAPSGATAEYYKSKGHDYPPEYGPLAAVTPGTPGGLMVMLAEYGKLSLKDVLEPSIQMADGFAIEAQLANGIERNRGRLKEWRYSREVLLPNAQRTDVPPTPPAASTPSGITPSHDVVTSIPAPSRREAPEPGSIFKQSDLAATLRKLVAAEQA